MTTVQDAAARADFARVVLVAPRTRVDVALPVDVTVIDLVPLVLDLVGERRGEGADRDGWVLTRLDGRALARDRTLRAAEIVDGAVLRLAEAGPAPAPPVYDDAVDAVAAAVRADVSTRSANPAAGAVFALAGALVAALALIYSGHNAGNTAVAAVATVVALAVAAAVARRPGLELVATAVGAGGTAFAFVAGLQVVPGGYGRAGVALGLAGAAVVAVIALMATRTGAVVFVAATVLTTGAAVAAVIATVFDLRPLTVVAGLTAAAVGLLPVLPWAAVRGVRLPAPLVPTSGEALRASTDQLDLFRVERQARAARDALTGATAGCAALVSAGAALLVQTGSVLALLLALACTLTLVLRSRSLPTLVMRTVVLGCVLAGLGAGAVVGIVHRVHAEAASVVGGIAVVAGAVLLTVVVPQLTVSPVSRRFVDLLEALCAVAVVPLALGVLDLYAVVRHL